MQRRQLLKGAVTGTVIALAGCTGNGSDGEDGGGGDGNGDGGDGSGGDGSGGDGSGDGGGDTPTSGSEAESATFELWHDKADDDPKFQEAFAIVADHMGNELGGDYTINTTPYDSTDSYQGALRPVLGTEDGPAIYTWWTGQRLRTQIEDGFAHEVTDVWQDHIEAGRYTESTMNSFGKDGEAYAVPNGNSNWVMWYHKPTFEELGVEEPSTFEEFRGLADTILNESGGDVTPFVQPLKPSWTGFIWFQEFLVKKDPEFYNELCAGNRKYTEDVVVESINLIGDLAKKGYFGDAPQLSQWDHSDIVEPIHNGNYAMILNGDWVSRGWGNQDLDFSEMSWFNVPVINEDLDPQLIIEPSPFILHSGEQNKEALNAMADGVLSTEFRQKWNEFQGIMPFNSEVDPSYLSKPKQNLSEALASGEFQFQLRYWENAHPEVAVPASSRLQQIFQQPDQAESIAQQLEQLRADVHGSV